MSPTLPKVAPRRLTDSKIMYMLGSHTRNAALGVSVVSSEDSNSLHNGQISRTSPSARSHLDVSRAASARGRGGCATSQLLDPKESY